MMIGIVSYLPDNEKRPKRKEFVAKQLSFLRGIFPKKEIVIVAQNYHEDDYIKDSNITYLSYPKIGVSKARNIILKRFYESKEDFLLLADDDIVLYDYYDATALLKEVEKTPTKFFMCDRICANNPVYLPFKKDNYKDKNVQTHWKFIKQPFNTGAPFCLMRNIAKHTGLTIYFTEPKDEKNIFLEDVDFHIKWIMKGFTSYICTQWQMKDLGHNTSTIYTKSRIEEEKDSLNRLLMTYPFAKELIDANTGKRSYKYLQLHNRSKVRGYVKRANAFEYTDKEIPKR